MSDAREMAKKGMEAQGVAGALLDCYRAGTPAKVVEAVAHIQLSRLGDVTFMAMVIGALCQCVVVAERNAARAHGPLVTAAEQGMVAQDVSGIPWVVGVKDQMEAALANGDAKTYASTAVDGALRASKMDVPEGEMPFELELRYMAQLDQQTLTLMAAEAMRRLFNDGS